MDSVITDKYGLYHGDCLNILQRIENNTIQLCLCDLPYGVLNKSNKAAQWDKPIDLKLLWKELKRVGTDNCAFIFFASGLFTHDLIESNRKDFKYTLVWDKKVVTGFLNAKKQPLRRHEDILVFYQKQCVYNPQFTKGKPSHIRGENAKSCNRLWGSTEVEAQKIVNVKKYTDEKYPTSILLFEKNIHVLNHPTEKPVSILEYLIKTYSNEGDVVLDPTMGSGSCGEACLNTQRIFIGIEMNDTWFAFAKKRIENKIKENNNETQNCL